MKIQRMVSAIFSCLIFQSVNASPILSNPTPQISYNNNTVILRMDLNGIPAYGANNSGSDILYTGDAGSWKFNLAAFGITGFETAALTAALMLDDHYVVPTSIYALDICLNSELVFSGPTNDLGLVHGTGGVSNSFTGWQDVTFSTEQSSDSFEVLMLNTSGTYITTPGWADWIGIDYLELSLVNPEVIPEPGTFSLALLGFGLMLSLKKRRKSNIL